VLAAAGIYGAIGREVAARGDHGWDHRAGPSAAAKIGWIARALGQAVQRNRLYSPAPRDPDLWTRPRS
jgi:phytoene synthase